MTSPSLEESIAGWIAVTWGVEADEVGLVRKRWRKLLRLCREFDLGLFGRPQVAYDHRPGQLAP